MADTTKCGMVHTGMECGCSSVGRCEVLQERPMLDFQKRVVDEKDELDKRRLHSANSLAIARHLKRLMHRNRSA